MRLTVFDATGVELTSSECFINADGLLEDVTRLETFYLESEIALCCLNEGGCYWGTLTDADDNVEAYFVFEGEYRIAKGRAAFRALRLSAGLGAED